MIVLENDSATGHGHRSFQGEYSGGLDTAGAALIA